MINMEDLNEASSKGAKKTNILDTKLKYVEEKELLRIIEESMKNTFGSSKVKYWQGLKMPNIKGVNANGEEFNFSFSIKKNKSYFISAIVITDESIYQLSTPIKKLSPFDTLRTVVESLAKNSSKLKALYDELKNSDDIEDEVLAYDYKDTL